MSLPNWVMYALLSMLFAGVTSVIAKFGLKNVGGDAGLAVRTTFVFALIWLNTIAFRHFKEFGGLTKKDVLFLFCIGHHHVTFVDILLSCNQNWECICCGRH